MSRAERERWQLAQERWPALQNLFSEAFGDEFLGDIKILPKRFQEIAAELPLAEKQRLATEAWDIRTYLGARYDDVSLVRDGLGARGDLDGYTQDNGYQPGLKRMMLFYDALIASIRAEAKDWKP